MLLSKQICLEWATSKTTYKRCNLFIVFSHLTLPIWDCTGDGRSHPTCHLLQWLTPNGLRKKNQSSPCECTEVYNHGACLPTFWSSSVPGPETLPWGPSNWSLKSLWREKKDQGWERKMIVCMPGIAWGSQHTPDYLTHTTSREGGSTPLCWLPSQGHQQSRGTSNVWGK